MQKISSDRGSAIVYILPFDRRKSSAAGVTQSASITILPLAKRNTVVSASWYHDAAIAEAVEKP